jgi:hypothetical protein
MMRPVLALGLLAMSLRLAEPSGTAVIRTMSFEVAQDAEVVASLKAGCEGCDWGRAGREAAVLRLEVDDAYSQHLFLTRGAAAADYNVLLGPLGKGAHSLKISLDRRASARNIANAEVTDVAFTFLPSSDPEHDAVALAPVLYARPNTIGRFSDVPLLMWYEKETTERGFRFRYSVVFSNEDGGTPADRLLATWGRLTDLEYVYGIEFDRNGSVVEETFQGKDHQIVPFRGRREGRHPLLYVVTDNNMVRDEGVTQQRYTLAPLAVDLRDASRELVMDQHPWTYTVTAREARREGRVANSPRPGSKRIFDPRRYAVLEACAAPEDSAFATFTFALGVADGRGGTRFFDSTGRVPEFRISRSPDNFPNGCFRGAVALPEGASAEDLKQIRMRAHSRPPKKGEAAGNGQRGPARLRRITRLFLMNAEDQPDQSVFSWTGELTLSLDRDPVNIQIHPTHARR